MNLFGFCEDYDKVVYDMRYKLTLERKSNDDAIFKIAAVDRGKVELTMVAWVMPRIHPNDVKMFSLYKSIESKIPARTRTFDWRLGVRTAPENQDMF